MNPLDQRGLLGQNVKLFHIHEHVAAGLEADAIGGHRGVDRHREGLFAIVDEDFGAETVQNEAEFQFAAPVTDEALPLMDEVPGGL